MSTATATLTPPVQIDITGVHTRPGLGRLVAVELRKTVNTRAGFWLQVAMVALTAIVVTIRSVMGDAADHTFAAVLDVGIQPAAVLLPVAGILLVTSEWSQRTGLVTFTLVPRRLRVFGAKLIASLVLGMAMLLVTAAIVAMGVLITSGGAAGAWSDAPTLVAQSAVFLLVGMVTGVAFGAMLRATTPAIVVLFAVPSSWAAIVSLQFFDDIAAWVDTARALGPLHSEVLDATQWAHVGTASVLWMLLPLLIGTWRTTRGDAAA